MNTVDFIENGIRCYVCISHETSDYRDYEGSHLFSYEVSFVNLNPYDVKILTHIVKLWNGFGEESNFNHYGLDHNEQRVLPVNKEVHYVAAVNLESELFTIQLSYFIQDLTALSSSYYLTTPRMAVYTKGKIN